MLIRNHSYIQVTCVTHVHVVKHMWTCIYTCNININMHESMPTPMQMLTYTHKHLNLHVNSTCTHRNTCTHMLQVLSGIRLGTMINLMFDKSQKELIPPYLHPTQKGPLVEHLK